MDAEAQTEDEEERAYMVRRAEMPFIPPDQMLRDIWIDVKDLRSKVGILVSQKLDARVTTLEFKEHERAGSVRMLSGLGGTVKTIALVASVIISLLAFNVAQARAASPYAQGFDYSTWNNPTSVPLAGSSFAFARASYGVYTDGKYAIHDANFRRAGLADCAYHFGTGAASGQKQAAVFMSMAHGAKCLALDLEYNPPKYGGPMTWTQAREFISTIHAAGRQVGLYASAANFPYLGQDWNWVAIWGSRPPTIAWRFWQWQGVSVDRDAYHGTATEMRNFTSNQRLIPIGRVVVTSVLQIKPYLTFYTAAAAQVRIYIARLSAVARPSALQKAELATYRARLIVLNADVAYLRAMATVQRYIANLAAVARPTAWQKTELAMYRARLAGWLANPRVM